MGRVFYVPKFISTLTELFEPFHKLLKKNVIFQVEQGAASIISDSQGCR